MTTNVHTVRDSDPLKKVVALICEYRISGVPVLNSENHLVGLISERDILEAMHPQTRGARHDRGKSRPPRHGLRDIALLRARDIMIYDVITAAPDTDPLRLASLMARWKIRRIPIVEGKRLVGIVSQGDVYRAIFQNDQGKSDLRRETEAPPLSPRENTEEREE